MKTIGKLKLLIALIISIILVASVYLYSNKVEIEEIPYRSFLNHIEKNEIDEVQLKDGAKLKGKLKNGKAFITDNPRRENLKEYLLLYNINVIEEDSNKLVGQGVSIVLVLIGVGTIVYLNKKNNKKAEKEIESMSQMDVEGSTDSKLTFNEVAGNEEVKESLKELVDFIKNPDKYNKYGARLPRGVLLYGPPGTGKTLLAKALAGEANVPFYAVSGSDFIQVYSGLGASRIRELFKSAKEHGKSVIFIDEIDSLGKKRKGLNNQGGNEEGDRTLNALLTEMSGFKGNEGIIVVAATNRIDTLDEALLRPGRFDRQVEVGLPDINAREAILKLHSINKPICKKVDLKKVASDTIYFSGAKLENLMNESAMLAAREKEKNITMEHIDKAYFTILVGEEKKDRSNISLKDKRITAYHEAGHALIAKKISNLNRVTKVSIIPSTKGVGGFSLSIPEDKMYQTKNDIITNIMIALGGRAAEDIIFGKDNITTGASSDLERATKMTLSMIGDYGMDDELGLLNYNVILNNNLNTDMTLVDKARDILEDYYINTKTMLMENKKYLHLMAKSLLEKESLNEDEINAILAS